MTIPRLTRYVPALKSGPSTLRYASMPWMGALLPPAPRAGDSNLSLNGRKEGAEFSRAAVANRSRHAGNAVSACYHERNCPAANDDVAPGTIGLFTSAVYCAILL